MTQPKWMTKNKRVAKSTIEWLKKAEKAILARQSGMAEIDVCITCDYDPQTAMVFVKNCILEYGLKSVRQHVNQDVWWPCIPVETL